jgi:CRP/FNR family cyclic AMP-dependent transcriptional regulator
MLQPSAIVDLIRDLKVPLFGMLNPNDLQALVPHLQHRKFAPNELVFSKGDRGDVLYVIVSGQMKLSVPGPDGRELSFRITGPGEIVGEIAVLDGGRRTANLTSLSESETLTIGRTSLSDLMTARPTICQVLIQFLCNRVRRTSEQLENVALHSNQSAIGLD